PSRRRDDCRPSGRRGRGEEVRWYAGPRPRRVRPSHTSSSPRAPGGRRRVEEEGRAEEEEVIAGHVPAGLRARLRASTAMETREEEEGTGADPASPEAI